LSQSDCGENNGVARLTITSGSGNYDTHAWGSDAIRDNLAPGFYEYLIMDNNTGCEVIVNFTITDLSTATIVVNSVTEVSCLGEADATVSYDLTIGAGFAGVGEVEIINSDGISYSNGALPAGDYCLFVIDDNGCISGDACFTVESPEALNINLSKTDVNCSQPATISVDIAGGSGNYNFDWADLAVGIYAR